MPAIIWNGLDVVTQVILFLIIVAGVIARIAALPIYVPDSGDEWGNTIAPFRVLLEHGNPGLFFHPSLCYYVTALAYAAVFLIAKVIGAVDSSLSMTDLFVLDERYFIFAARGVSVLSAALAMSALYALGTSLWHRRAGLMAAALLAVLPLHAIYSDAVRVDSFFLPVFIYAFSRIVGVLHQRDQATYDRAGFFTGLAIGANYSGAILIPWLVASHFLQAAAGGRRDRQRIYRALGLAAVTFLASSPFILIDFETSSKYLAFISGLGVTGHPGIEGAGVLFYAEYLIRTNPYLCAAIGASIVILILLGNRTERFVLSLPIAYFVLFSLLRTKFDRFMLPALALFLLVSGGLPLVLARRLARWRIAVVASYALSYALLFLCIRSMTPQSIPVPRHEMLGRPDAALFDWIERNVPRRSNILVEAGILPLIDTLMVPGGLAAALQHSIVTIHPNLDQQFIGAGYVGEHSNYEPAVLTAKRIDYVIVSSRNVRNLERQCGSFPDVCAFYEALRARGRPVFQTPGGLEEAIVYDVRR